MKKISILGSTGSIGSQTLDVVRHHPDRYQVVALAAGSNWSLLLEQIQEFQPKLVSVSDRETAEKLRMEVPNEVKVLYGEEGLIEAAAHTEAEFVVSAVVGSLGLKPVLKAIEAGKTIGLANKETLVSAGHIVTKTAAAHGTKIIPIDSEHSAIFQCLNGEPREKIKRIILTASGGAFRDKTRSELTDVTVEDALAHPNWSMGAKVTIDAATMANKGLEVIEAHWLFGLDYDRIDVVIHPESIIHSLVEFVDHSVMAQLGMPDMRVPIQYALTWPDRLESPAPALDLTQLGRLNFRKMDQKRFPCLKMAYDSGRAGGTYPTVFNAANEVAVHLFLERRIRFLEIEDLIAKVLEQHKPTKDPDLEDIFAADAWARKRAYSLL